MFRGTHKIRRHSAFLVSSFATDENNLFSIQHLVYWRIFFFPWQFFFELQTRLVGSLFSVSRHAQKSSLVTVLSAGGSTYKQKDGDLHLIIFTSVSVYYTRVFFFFFFER